MRSILLCIFPLMEKFQQKTDQNSLDARQTGLFARLAPFQSESPFVLTLFA